MCCWVNGGFETRDAMSDVLAAKQALRSSMRAELRSLVPAVLAEWAADLRSHLLTAAREWAPGRVVSVFGGLRAEPDLLAEIVPDLVQMGHRAVLFAIEGDALVAYEVTSVGDAVRGMMGVWEPASSFADVSMDHTNRTGFTFRTPEEFVAEDGRVTVQVSVQGSQPMRFENLRLGATVDTR